MKIKFYDFSQIARMEASCCNHQMHVTVHLEGLASSQDLSFESDREQIWLEGPDPTDLFKVPMGPGNLVCQSINGWKKEMLDKVQFVEVRKVESEEQEFNRIAREDLSVYDNPRSSKFNPFKYQEEQESGRHQRIADMLDEALDDDLRIDDPTECCPTCHTMYDPNGVCPKCPSPIQV